MWPPQKKISWKWWSYIPEWRKPGKPSRCERFFGFSGFQWDFFRGGGAVFGVERSCKKWCRCSMTSGPILRKMLPFWKVGGSNLSNFADTLYNQMMAVVRLKGVTLISRIVITTDPNFPRVDLLVRFTQKVGGQSFHHLKKVVTFWIMKHQRWGAKKTNKNSESSNLEVKHHLKCWLLVRMMIQTP